MQIMTATQGTQSKAVIRKKRKKANGSALAPVRVRVSALTPSDGVSPIFLRSVQTGRYPASSLILAVAAPLLAARQRNSGGCSSRNKGQRS
ncbi:hypothetical protein BGC31_11245 [Komagataeibacter xylinus]|uniref:Uncharacterized protein n=2 Tax=Komagataeibacter TaxID=1434011 RepID=A0A2V4RLP5_9PROT|nr:hypothetical protein H845_3702 [Komagataeibacter xylinus E25]PYD68462.1 hypothetical protein CFR76_14870 [Komagataeibacter swingsii]RFO99954.1 hypothetical protein BFX83_11065 [Komagataeibacter xylinus]GBQ57497.1 hypothetical protein AA16373_1020 [Komagataeibacter swingsii DSM 16373]GBQ70378.1 hypothetical protein AA0521_1665 [Komagataeibacter intermedius NRIC 0521]